MSEDKKEASVLELPLAVTQIAFDSSLAFLLAMARVAKIANKSLEAGIDKYIELMEEEMKKPPKERIEVE